MAIERRAFMNLDQLRYLTLRGNKLETISDEAFQVSVRFTLFTLTHIDHALSTVATYTATAEKRILFSFAHFHTFECIICRIFLSVAHIHPFAHFVIGRRTFHTSDGVR